VEALRISGSKHMAACEASPHLKLAGSRDCGLRTFQDEAARDPVFAARIRNALSECLGRLEKEMLRRCFVPDVRESEGRSGTKLRDESWRSANALALRVAERHSRDWVQHRNVDSTVTLSHEQRTTNLYTLSESDLLALSDDDRNTLVEILRKIEDNRPGSILPPPNDEPDDLALPAPSEASPQAAPEAIDAEFEVRITPWAIKPGNEAQSQ
jgi:predicted  nucleic acid-binding Zn-ribbon protein